MQERRASSLMPEEVDAPDADDWAPVPRWGLIALGLVALWFAWAHFVGREAWVFLVDWANLALHEAGHPIVGLFSERLMIYGGTIFQLLFPALFAHHFWRRRQAAAFAAALLWLAESLMNVSRYMKDARAQELPLVGGGEHDWTEIFGRWGVLAHDVGIGNGVRLLGLALAVYALWWAWQRREGG